MDLNEWRLNATVHDALYSGSANVALSQPTHTSLSYLFAMFTSIIQYNVQSA